MHIEIVSPDRELYSGEIDYVQMPGSKGSFGILKNHAPMIATLAAGDIFIKETGGSEKNITVKGGVIEVLKNKIMVLAK
jgi:F-type H+-transporting ATPase subunit epsilon